MRNPMAKFWRFCVLVSALTASGAVQAGQFVVIASNDSSLRLGSVLSKGQSVTIAAGERATLVSEAGATVTRTGPFSDIPAPSTSSAPEGAGGGVVASLSKLLTNNDVSTKQIGAVRSIVPGKPPPSLWMLDSRMSGDHCMPAGEPLIVWRSKSASASKLSVKRLPKGKRYNFASPAGAKTVMWPENLVRESGTKYLLRTAGGGSAKITLKVIRPGFATPAHQAAWMADNGCRRQAIALLESIGK